MSEISPGEFHLRTVCLIEPKAAQRTQHMRKRASQRLIEEVVELMFELGCSTGDIYTSVTDAIHNESKKHSQYPSQLQELNIDPKEVLGEVADVTIVLDYIRHACKITQQDVESQIWEKLKLGRKRVEAGECKVVDYNVYKISSGR